MSPVYLFVSDIYIYIYMRSNKKSSLDKEESDREPWSIHGVPCILHKPTF